MLDFQKEVWEQNYRGIDDKIVDDTWKRVARHVASCENRGSVRLIEGQFYNVLAQSKFIPGGRILSNAGNKRKGATEMNCYVDEPERGTDPDSMNSIFDLLKNQALTLASEGGYGMNFSWLRPEGTFVEGTGIRTPGVLSFLDLWNESSRIITAGASKIVGKRRKDDKLKIRKGAMMAVLDCWHKDIIDFIKAKQVPNRLDKFNLSVGITEGFIEAVINDENWDLVFPDYENCKEEYKKYWNGDIEDWKQRGLPVVVYETIKARELWNIIIQSTYNRNEPGVIFLDNANKLNPLAYCERIRASNPCVVGDTLILTNKGWIAIKILTEIFKKGLTKDVRIITMNKEGVLEESELKWCGITKENDDIVKITFGNKEFRLVNKTHKFYNEMFNEVEVKELKVGDKVLKWGGITEVCDIEELNYKEDVYDLTCDPNFNFFSMYGIESDFSDEKIIVNDDLEFFNYSLVKLKGGEIKFAKELQEGDDIDK